VAGLQAVKFEKALKRLPLEIFEPKLVEKLHLSSFLSSLKWLFYYLKHEKGVYFSSS